MHSLLNYHTTSRWLLIQACPGISCNQYNHILLSTTLFVQVAELALVKLFDNFSSELLVSSMVSLMRVDAKPELWGEETPVSTSLKKEGGEEEEVC